jgi:hypothetical protein
VSERLPRAAAVLAIVAVLGIAGWLVLGAVREAGRLPEGPVPVAFDRAACAHCRMLVGETSFAAQLQGQDGQIFDFDDPGCLLRFEAERRPAVHARWFHHLREERWLPGDAVAFVAVEPTPMGYGLGAVDAGTPGALSLDAARRHVEEVAARHRGSGAEPAVPAATLPAAGEAAP